MRPNKKDQAEALRWWGSFDDDVKRSLHKKSKHGHIPYEAFTRFNVLITHLYKAHHGKVD